MRFGWAYVNSLVTGAVANGPTNSVQFNSGSQVLSGSSNFTFNPATNEVILLGELTGSTLVISASVVSASTYLGIPSSTPGDGDKSIQFNSGSTFSGSNNLTFDYTTNTLFLSGNILGSSAIKGGYSIYTGSFTVPSTSYFVGISTTGSIVTASLSSATNYPAGQTMYFKDVGGNAGTNNVRIQPSGSQTIDGATGGVIIASNSGSITLVSNGTDQFYIVGMI